MAKRTLMFKDEHDVTPSPQKIAKKDDAQKKITSPLSPSEIHSPDTHVTVQALVASVSPVKPSKYFDGEMTDGESVIRFVGFDKCQQEMLHSLYTSGIPVSVKDCQIQRNKFNNKLEIVMKSCTKLEQSNAEFFVDNLKTVGSIRIDIGHLGTLNDYDRVTVQVAVVKVNEPEEITGGKRKQDVTIADATGSTILTLWESDIDSLEVSKSYQLNRLMVRVYLGKHQLSYPKSGASIELINDIEEVIDAPFSSDDEDESLVGASITGIQLLEKLYSCIICKRSVQPGQSANIGTCTNCDTMQKLTDEKFTAKLYLDKQGKRFSLRAYNDILKKIVHQDDITCENLLCAPPFDLTYNKFHVITSVTRK